MVYIFKRSRSADAREIYKYEPGTIIEHTLDTYWSIYIRRISTNIE